MTDQRFHEAVELYGDMVFRLAYSYLKNRADAEDVMQERSEEHTSELQSQR